MKNLFITLIVVITLSSCATHSGIITGNASISDANFNIKELAIDTANTQLVFGIGGLGKDALVLKAKRNLYTNYPSRKGQAFANVSVDIKRSFYPFVFNTKATISADVIDFNTAQEDSSFIAFNENFSKVFDSPFEANQKVI
ncbi:DUF6567 family protein [Carboxylicivirga marina]|uniref:Lipoprotein n=1 Tax=Carboxylicivirga marina TaxID=2800988 RepID=A0ABS1HJY7_9BACT|nr:DUF6567 family protein [Carboxylicivirga marina]MBK3517588.1 hypothetical protein [Carboxylicivirga marina]